MSLEDRIVPASLFAQVTGNDLTIQDTANATNNLTITFDSTAYVITDAVEQFIVAPPGGTLSPDGKTLTMPTTTFSGKIIFQLGAGNDVLTADWTTVNFSRDVDCNTIPGSSQFVIKGGSFDSAVETRTGPFNGKTVLDPAGPDAARTFSFSQLSTLDVTNPTIVTYTHNTSNLGTTLFLEDEGVTGNGISRLRPQTGCVTKFNNPGTSLTVLPGSASDSMTINKTQDFSQTLVLGSATSPFAVVTVAGTLSIGLNQSLSVFSTNSISMTTTNSDVSTSGTGTILLSAAALVMLNGASLSCTSGGLMDIACDTITLNPGSSVNAGTNGTAKLHSKIAARSIILGGNDSNGLLALSDAELDLIARSFSLSVTTRPEQ